MEFASMHVTQCARAIYLRAKPGQFEAYSEYLRTQVEPIDHAAQQHGALTSFMTLVDKTPGAPWSHMRLFVFATTAQRADMVVALAQAAAVLTPNAEDRTARSAFAASLRDKVGESDFDLLD